MDVVQPGRDSRVQQSLYNCVSVKGCFYNLFTLSFISFSLVPSRLKTDNIRYSFLPVVQQVHREVQLQ
jgi:hypothetical protein